MSSISDSDDIDAIRRCLDGETEAFDELVVRYQKTVFNAAYRIANDPEDAREIAQSVFLKVYQNLSVFDQQRRFFSWLYRVVVNESLSLVASRRRFEQIEETMPAPSSSSPESVLESSELGRQIDDGLRRLSPDHRAVIVVRHFLSCSYEEGADILGVPEKTFKSRLFAARRALREELLALYPDMRAHVHG